MNKLDLKMKSMKVAFLAALSAMLFVTASCGDDDDDTPTPAPLDDIVTIAQGNSDLSSLVAALTKFPDLVTALSGDGSFTVFAPSNAAFATLLSDLEFASLDDVPDATLRTILEYHVISGNALAAGDLSDGQTASTLGGENVNVSVSGSSVQINDSNVTTADVEASNGIVHVIDAVLFPPSLMDMEPEPPTGPTQNIVELAQGSPDLSILVEALVKFDDLVAALSDADGNYTVFAPTNDAFVALLGVIGQTELDDIPEDVLRRVLSYHVVAGTAALSTDLSNG
ncbi:MAG: fasciclin domain-containing protein, partial [Bacteroidota bacterium]